MQNAQSDLPADDWLDLNPSEPVEIVTMAGGKTFPQWLEAMTEALPLEMSDWADEFRASEVHHLFAAHGSIGGSIREQAAWVKARLMQEDWGSTLAESAADLFGVGYSDQPAEMLEDW